MRFDQFLLKTVIVIFDKNNSTNATHSIELRNRLSNRQVYTRKFTNLLQIAVCVNRRIYSMADICFREVTMVGN